MIFLETRRLILRNVAPRDAAAIYDYRNSEVCARYQRGQTRTRSGIDALVQRRRNDLLSLDAPALLAIALKETDELVGEVVVMPQDGTISLGYTVSYLHHRKGYAFEALTAAGIKVCQNVDGGSVREAVERFVKGELPFADAPNK